MSLIAIFRSTDTILRISGERIGLGNQFPSHPKLTHGLRTIHYTAKNWSNYDHERNSDEEFVRRRWKVGGGLVGAGLLVGGVWITSRTSDSSLQGWVLFASVNV